jgi:hypothetical protein
MMFASAAFIPARLSPVPRDSPEGCPPPAGGGRVIFPPPSSLFPLGVLASSFLEGVFSERKNASARERGQVFLFLLNSRA